jgi:hypothetical protein
MMMMDSMGLKRPNRPVSLLKNQRIRLKKLNRAQRVMRGLMKRDLLTLKRVRLLRLYRNNKFKLIPKIKTR